MLMKYTRHFIKRYVVFQVEYEKINNLTNVTDGLRPEMLYTSVAAVTPAAVHVAIDCDQKYLSYIATSSYPRSYQRPLVLSVWSVRFVG